MKILILEDDGNRVKEFRKRFIGIGIPLFVDTASEAIKLIRNADWTSRDLICLDHDLGGETYVNTNDRNTGSEVARFLEENPVQAMIVIHSLNTAAARYMFNRLNDKHDVYRVPFFWTEETFRKVIK